MCWDLMQLAYKQEHLKTFTIYRFSFLEEDAQVIFHVSNKHLWWEWISLCYAYLNMNDKRITEQNYLDGWIYPGILCDLNISMKDLLQVFIPRFALSMKKIFF